MQVRAQSGAGSHEVDIAGEGIAAKANPKHTDLPAANRVCVEVDKVQGYPAMALQLDSCDQHHTGHHLQGAEPWKVPAEVATAEIGCQDTITAKALKRNPILVALGVPPPIKGKQTDVGQQQNAIEGHHMDVLEHQPHQRPVPRDVKPTEAQQ